LELEVNGVLSDRGLTGGGGEALKSWPYPWCILKGCCVGPFPSRRGLSVLIAKDSILLPLTKLRVQIAATIAVSSFRSSARRDQTLSFRIKRAAIWPVRLILARLDRRPRRVRLPRLHPRHYEETGPGDRRGRDDSPALRNPAHVCAGRRIIDGLVTQTKYSWYV
jgi:hypothetical protein